jgi:hypothetical protein
MVAKKILRIENLIVIFLLISFGCASSPKVVKPSSEDQIIIDAGIKKANELGLRPFPMIGEGKGGRVTVIGPATITYDLQGNWITFHDDLYINATQGDILLKGLNIKRGQYAREIDSKLKIVE